MIKIDTSEISGMDFLQFDSSRVLAYKFLNDYFKMKVDANLENAISSERKKLTPPTKFSLSISVPAIIQEENDLTTGHNLVSLLEARCNPSIDSNEQHNFESWGSPYVKDEKNTFPINSADVDNLTIGQNRLALLRINYFSEKNSKMYSNFWRGEKSPLEKRTFDSLEKIQKYFRDSSECARYPDILAQQDICGLANSILQRDIQEMPGLGYMRSANQDAVEAKIWTGGGWAHNIELLDGVLRLGVSSESRVSKLRQESGKKYEEFKKKIVEFIHTNGYYRQTSGLELLAYAKRLAALANADDLIAHYDSVAEKIVFAAEHPLETMREFAITARMHSTTFRGISDSYFKMQDNCKMIERQIGEIMESKNLNQETLLK